jgi:hypothetical protein
MPRFIIEGTWSGYTAAQKRVCHRTVTTRKRLAEDLAKIHTVEFTDYTKMYIEVRPAKRAEKVTEMKTYSEMLGDFVRHGMTGFVRVADLPSD